MLTVPMVNQNDPRWKYTQVGYSRETIGDAGSALACLEMLGSYAHHMPAGNLNSLNAGLKTVQGFYDKNRIRWAVAPMFYPALLFTGICELLEGRPAQPHEMRELHNRLALAVPVIVFVEFPAGKRHYVLVTDRNNAGGDSLTIQDPRHGDSARMVPRYGRTVVMAIRGMVLFDIIPQNDRPKLTT